MEPSQIYSKIDSLYKEEKSRGFILHLLNNFLPLSKAFFLLDPIKDAKCCITAVPLISKMEAFGITMDVAMEQLQHTVKKSMGEIKPDEESPLKKALGGRVLGIRCEGSRKLMCKEALDQLLLFAQDRILKGDKRVQNIASGGHKSHGKNGQKNHHRPEPKPATQKLGDFEALIRLKKMYEDEDQRKG